MRELWWVLLAAGTTINVVTFLWLYPALMFDGHSDKSAAYKDSLTAAMQTGRLDLVSSLLAIVAILAGIAAIFGFGYVKSETRRIAEDEARLVAEKAARDETRKIVPPLARRTVVAYIKTMRANDIAESDEATEAADASADDDLQEMMDALRREDENGDGND